MCINYGTLVLIHLILFVVKGTLKRKLTHLQEKSIYNILSIDLS